MKAYILHGIDRLKYEDVIKPACPDGWAIVKVMAAGICSSDIARIFTKGAYHYPLIPGHEFAGFVDSVGNNCDLDLIEKKVGIFPLIPCRECPQCQKKHFETCAHYDYVGSRRDGGFAEYVAVPIWNLIPLPENIPYTAAAMLEPLSVALHAIKLGNVQKGQSVGIVGTGMIGISAAQWAKKMGAEKVTVIGRNECKRTLVENIGIEYVTVSDLEFPQYDIILEAVGTLEAIECAVKLTYPGGTTILMGNPASDIMLRQDIYWQILRKQLTMKGTWNSAYDGNNPSDWTEAVQALEKGEINVEPLISHIYNQEDMGKALDIMRDHREPYCKIMTLWNQ